MKYDPMQMAMYDAPTLMGIVADKTHDDGKRPWGNFFVLHEQPGYKVKQIQVDPGCRISYQRHQNRDEYWTIVSGRGHATVGPDIDERFAVGPGSTVSINRTEKHRITNDDDKSPLIFIEVQLGDYLGEDDIERFEDDYGRV